MYLKIMKFANKHDDDSTVVYSIYDNVLNVLFRPDQSSTRVTVETPMFAEIEFMDGGTRTVPVTGNCYIMNEHGKTISHFFPSVFASHGVAMPVG